MLDELRKPFFLAALVLITLAFLVELGASLLPAGDVDPGQRQQAMASAGFPPDSEVEPPEADFSSPPGIAIPYLAILDALVLLTIGLMALSLLLPGGVHGRIQGVTTLVVSLLTLLLGIVLIFVALGLLLLMVGLFLAAPFGTFVYLARWGFFALGSASAALALAMALKIGFAVCLVLAHQRFLQNKGLVLIILTSLLATFLVGLLHNFVPFMLISMADVLGALVVAILACIWALVLCIGALPAIVKALRLRRLEA